MGSNILCTGITQFHSVSVEVFVPGTPFGEVFVNDIQELFTNFVCDLEVIGWVEPKYLLPAFSFNIVFGLTHSKP